MTDQAKAISNYYSNYNRYVRKFISNQTMLSRTYQQEQIIKISSMIESLFLSKLQLRELQLCLSKCIKLCETAIIREFRLKLSTSIEILNFRLLDLSRIICSCHSRFLSKSVPETFFKFKQFVLSLFGNYFA